MHWSGLVPGQVNIGFAIYSGTDEITNGAGAAVESGTDFGARVVDCSITNRFSITNSGNRTLVLTGLSTNGAEPFKMTDFPATVAVHSVSNFALVFSPVTAGVYEATISFTNNSDATNFAFGVRGAGVTGSGQSVSPTSLVYSCAVGTNPAGQAITLENSAATARTWMVETVYEGTGGWFSVSEATNVVLGHGVVTITGDVTAVGLTGGVYRAENRVVEGASTVAVQAVELTVCKAAGSVMLGDLNQTYNGSGLVVSVQTAPTGLTVNVTYEGLASGPTNAGSYEVIGLIDEPLYSGGATELLQVARAVDTITFGETNPMYNGAAKWVSSNSLAGNPVLVTYDGSVHGPTNAGTYAVTGVVDVLNWTGTNTTVLTIERCLQYIMFGGLTNQTLEAPPFGIRADGGPSGAPVVFSNLTPTVISLVGTNVTLLATGTATIAASLAGDENYWGITNTQSFEVFPALMWTVEVVSVYGQADPPVGIYTWTNGRVMSCAVTNATVTQVDSQYVCWGWSGSGSVSFGTDTNMSFTVQTNSVLVWGWNTNVWWERSAGAHGQVAGTQNGWYWFNGAVVSATGQPNAYYEFDHWEGDIEEPFREWQVVTLLMDRPRRIEAVFRELLATNSTPQWWLAQYGWTNAFDTAALADPDGDGMLTWQEYVACTDPTNRSSVFHMTIEADTGPMVLQWQPSASGRVYRLRGSDSLPGPFTNLCEVPWETGRWTATTHNAAGFYSIGVEKP